MKFFLNANTILAGCLRSAKSVGIIGGADGPTAIYVAGKASLSPLGICLLILGLIAAGVCGYVCLKRFKGKKDR